VLASAPVILTRKLVENPAVMVIATVWPYVQSLFAMENAGRGRPDRTYGGTNLVNVSYTISRKPLLGNAQLTPRL
jgi:hypothetical protein